MGASFTVGALALAGLRANAIGAVRIDLVPEAIEIELVRVAAFSPGFAPGGVARPTRLRVPYTAVRGLVRQGGLLYLAFDSNVVAPHNRFALAGFSLDPADALVRSFRARLRARWATVACPVPLGALAAMLVPDTLATGLLGRASVGALVALALFGIFRELWAWSTWGGPEADRLRDRFEAELSERLALVAQPLPARDLPPVLAMRLKRRRPAPPPPAPAREARPVSAAPPEDRGWSLASAKPLAAVVAAALGVVAVMAFVGHYAAPRAPGLAVPRLVAGLGAAVRSAHAAPLAVAEAERCVCTRASSPLWSDGVPRLAVLTFHGEEEASTEVVAGVDRKGAPFYDFDLAIVNDSDRPVHDVTFTLVFARRNGSGRRVVVDRGLFWEGVFGPGQAGKWRVKAPGSEMRIDASVTGTLEEAHLEAAPADAFFKLTASRFRAVRVHAARMLAYLRDPRAESVVRALEAQGGADGPLLDRIRRASAPVFACEVARTEDRVEACVFNASTRAKRRLAMREVRAEAAAPSVPIEVEVPVHEGRRVTAALPEDGGGEIEIVDGEQG